MEIDRFNEARQEELQARREVVAALRGVPDDPPTITSPDLTSVPAVLRSLLIARGVTLTVGFIVFLVAFGIPLLFMLFGGGIPIWGAVLSCLAIPVAPFAGLWTFRHLTSVGLGSQDPGLSIPLKSVGQVVAGVVGMVATMATIFGIGAVFQFKTEGFIDGVIFGVMVLGITLTTWLVQALAPPRDREQ